MPVSNHFRDNAIHQCRCAAPCLVILPEKTVKKNRRLTRRRARFDAGQFAVPPAPKTKGNRTRRARTTMAASFDQVRWASCQIRARSASKSSDTVASRCDLITKCDTVSGVATTRRGSGKDELMKKALMGVSAAAAIALAPLCIPPAQAHADDPCVSITDPAAHQACIDGFRRDNPMRRYPLGDCEGASPVDGQVGQVCG